MLNKLRLWPYFLFLAVFIIIPIILTLIISFCNYSLESIHWSFSFKYYRQINGTVNFWTIVFYSIYISCITTVFCAVFAIVFCYYLHNIKSKFLKKQLIFLATLPMWINALMKLIGLKTFFDFFFKPEFTQSSLGLIIGGIYIFMPLMIIPIYSVINKVDKNLIAASHDLGGKHFKTFFKIVIPLILPGIISGFTMTFLALATSVTIPQFIGANHIMIGQTIYNSVNQNLINLAITATILSCVAIFTFYGLLKMVLNLIFTSHYKGGKYV